MPVLPAPWRLGDTAGAGPAFVSHTVFRHDRWRDLPAIARDAERAARLWSRQRGALLLRQWIQPTTGQLGDLSVWRDEADLRAFLALSEHVALMTAWRGRMRGTHHSWRVERIDRRAIWRHAQTLL